MKKFAKLMLALGFASAVVTSTALAQLPPLPLDFYFDEVGNGILVGLPPSIGPNPLLLPGGPITDPTTGLTVLAYPIPANTTPGDVLLFEPNPTSPFASDVLRFIRPANNQTLILVYSDLEPGEPYPNPTPGDVPLELVYDPVTGEGLQPNQLLMNELGVEGANGAIWTVNGGSGQPGDAGFYSSGGFTGPINVTYHFFSDGVVPEPSSLALFGLAGGVALLRRRQRARA